MISTLTSAELLELATAPADDPRPAPPTLVVLAHPDDETLGLGARLSRFSGAQFVYLTDGSPRNMVDARSLGFATREDYAAARRGELFAALGAVGVSPRQIHLLNSIEQEAAGHMPRMVRRVARLIQQFRPEVIVTHAFEGGHPDHDAAAFVAHTAAQAATRPDGEAPVIIEMGGYHGTQRGLVYGQFLPAEGREEVRYALSAAEMKAKAALLAAFQTQQRAVATYPRGEEAFRIAPEYNFLEPPHPGRLHFETQTWSMNGSRWRTLARAAYFELGMRGRALR
jgi:LmbE family N-acetylglucosaminyl deacetylase